MTDEIDLRRLSAIELITYLDKAHPHENIRVGESELQAHRRAGTRDLIDSLIEMAKEDAERTD